MAARNTAPGTTRLWDRHVAAAGGVSTVHSGGSIESTVWNPRSSPTSVSPTGGKTGPRLHPGSTTPCRGLNFAAREPTDPGRDHVGDEWDGRMSAYKCSRCDTDLVSITLEVQDGLRTLHSCSRCDYRLWTSDDGSTINLGLVLDDLSVADANRTAGRRR